MKRKKKKISFRYPTGEEVPFKGRVLVKVKVGKYLITKSKLHCGNLRGLFTWSRFSSSKFGKYFRTNFWKF